MPRKLPGMKADRSYRIPVCSSCETSEHMRRVPDDKWSCIKCADEWLEGFAESRTRGASMGGVALPSGVRDERRKAPSFRDAIPNRAARRRMAK